MHSSLRPELRGAQRILRSIQQPKSVYSRRVVRSFSSYLRLQEESNPKGGSGKPADDQSIAGVPAAWIKEVYNKSRHLWGEKGELREGDLPKIDFTQIFADVVGKQKIHDEYVSKHMVPPGYVLIERKEDIPGDIPGHHPVVLPSLIADDPATIPRTISVGEGWKPQTPNVSNSPTSEIASKETSKETDSTDSANKDLAQNPRYHGSWQNRRKRAREIKSTISIEDQLPSWFYENNVTPAQSEAASQPNVVVVNQLTDGTYVPTTASLEQAQAQLPADKAPTETSSETLEQAYGTGGGRPSEEGSTGPSPAKEISDTSTSRVSLANDRYFIEKAQYQELLNTFKGRLQIPSETKTKGRDNPLALNHLTVLHGAKDADLLLDTLVLDLCKTVGADRVRLDAQDIAELISTADVDPHVAHKGGRLSFRVYNNIYGRQNAYSESFFGREEEEDDDNDNDDEDAMGPRGSVDIPIGSVVAFPGGGMPKNMFSDIRRTLSRSGGPLSQLFNGGSMGSSGGDSKQPSGLLGSLAESILDSSTHAQQMKSGHDKASLPENQTAPSRPMVIHLPNYRAMQEHQIAEGFMGELLVAAEKRIQQGRRIIVVGTDSMRDFPTTGPPRSILDEQETRSYGASSAIILTPVFPNRDAELALLRDREERIRNINARHLYLVLKSSRGVLLKGLEEGFWHRDYSAEIGSEDFKALAETFWPFMQIQRIAALVAGTQSQTPISDAVRTISESDESKVAWLRRNQPDLAKEDAKEADKPENKRLAKIKSKASRHEKKLLSGVIEPKKIATTFKDIHIPAETVEALQTLTTLSLVRPEAFKYGVLKSDRIPGLLLYGPPGTGKTLAAKAVAKESGATMLEVSAADLNDMYVGEGEKNVQALFSLAKKLSPCVVFLDEADAMFSARSAQGRRVSHRELLNQFLKEWDGMSNDSGSAFIMVATNRPMDLDDAVLRRLPRRLLVDLPTEADRLEILKIHLRQEAVAEEVNLPELAKKTPFYSGSDLKNVAVAAALNAVREENEGAKKFRQEHPDSEEKYTYPEKRVLTQPHFDKALDEITASISEDMSSLREIKKFDEQYGDRKGRKKKTPKWGFKSASEADKVLDTVKVRS